MIEAMKDGINALDIINAGKKLDSAVTPKTDRMVYNCETGEFIKVDKYLKLAEKKQWMRETLG